MRKSNHSLLPFVWAMSAYGLLACTGKTPEEGVSRADQAILNGNNSLPIDGQAFIYDTSVNERGSATALTGEWMLTAAHVVARATAASNIHVELRGETRVATEVRIHPLYRQNAEANTSSVDVALVRVSPAFTGVSPVTISNTKTAALMALPAASRQVNCFGYGRSQAGIPSTVLSNPNPAAPQLKTAYLTAQPSGSRLFSDLNFLVDRNNLGQITSAGDSGGGCFYGVAGSETLIGVNKSVPLAMNNQCRSNNDCPVRADSQRADCLIATGATVGICDSDQHNVATVQAAQSFYGFARAVTRSSATGSFMTASSSDRLTLRTGTSGNFEVYIEYQDGTNFTVPTGIADPGTSAAVQLEIDDYDADGHDDVMMMIQGKPVGQSSVISLGYLAGTRALGSPPDWSKIVLNSFVQGSTMHVPLPLKTSSIESNDVNGDGLPDIMTVGEGGERRYFFGNATGISKTEMLAYATLDVDRDGLKDYVYLSTDVNKDLLFHYKLGDGRTFAPPAVPADLDVTKPIQIFPGNFDGDTNGEDFVLLANQSLYFYRANGGGTAPVAGTLFSASATNGYVTRVNVMPPSAAGTNDLEVQVDDYYLSLYRSTSTGLKSTEYSWMQGMPTEDGEDGRLLTVSGQGLATVAEPRSTLKIATTEPIIDVQIFDGNYAGVHDLVDTAFDTCFQLWTDPCGDGLGECKDNAKPILIANALGSRMVEDGWSLLSRGAHQSVTSLSGAYVYRLEAFVTRGTDCTIALNQIDSIANNSPAGVNGFKVRANGTVSAMFGEFTVMASDYLGDWGTNGLPWMRDTNYDGTFWFGFDVSAAGEGIGLREADADDLDSAIPGVAEGKNMAIRHTLLTPANEFARLSRVVGQDTSGKDITVPINQDYVETCSGNFDAMSSAARSIESYRYEASVTPGIWYWYWENVFVQNNIHLFVPVGSPVTYELFGGNAKTLPMRRRLSSSSTVAAEAWPTKPIATYLPMVLGSREANGALAGTSRAVNDAATAQAILGSQTTQREKLERALLTAKLNIAQAQTLGERIVGGLVYGSTATVRETIDQADAMVRGPLAIFASADVERVVRRLSAINAGGVTYQRPGVPYPSNASGDTDGDGFLDIVDNCPVYSNADQLDTDGDSVGNACRVVPAADCILKSASGSRTAYFRYTSPLRYRSIPVGLRNRFTQGAEDRGQPIVFSGDGAHRFSVNMGTATSLTWQLEDTSATANALTPICSGADLTKLAFAQNVALFGEQQVTIADGVPVTAIGGASVVSSGTLELGATVQVANVWSRGDATLRSNAVISGNAIVGGTLSRQQGAVVGGVAIDHSYVAPYAIDWSVAFPAVQEASVRLEPGQARGLSPASYGTVNIQRAAVLSLTSGTYYFDALTVDAGGKLAIDDSTGPVIIYVKTSLIHRGAITTTSSTPNKVLLGYFGTTPAMLESPFDGTVIAPKSEIVLGSGPPMSFRGVFFGKRIQVRAGVQVAFAPFTS